MRQVGHGQQQRFHLLLNGGQAFGGLVQPAFEGGHLRHQIVGAFAFGLALADLLAGGVALRLQLFGAGLDGFALGFQRAEGRFVQKRLRVFAGGQALEHALQVFA